MMMAMMAMTALGGAAFMMGDMFLNSEDVIKKDGRIIAYHLLVDTVRKNLYAGSNCTSALAASSQARQDQRLSLIETASGFTTGAIDTVDMTEAIKLTTDSVKPPMLRGVQLMGLPLNLDNAPLTLEANWKAKSGTSIKSMRLIMDRIVPLPEGMGAAPRVVRYPDDPKNPDSTFKRLMAGDMYLVIEPDHKGINVWAPENKKFWIKLYAYIDADTKQIHSCYDPTSEAIFCTETMKGVYVNDPTLAANKRCRPDISCFTYMNGILPANVTCPAEDYKQTSISALDSPETGGFTPDYGSQLKTCTWCPSQPYDATSLTAALGVDDYLDLEDLSDLDCSAANPYAALSEQDAWENYNEYYALKDELTPELQAKYAGCLNYVPKCYSYPETCIDECTGDTSACDAVAATTTTGDTGTTTGDTGTTTTGDTGTTTGDTYTDRCGETRVLGTCFIAGTQVTMADGNQKSIEDVLLGEKVLDGSYREQKVQHLFKRAYKGLVYGINGGKHFFTPNHPFKTLDGWKSLDPSDSMNEIPGIKVKMLKVGDILVTKNGFEPIYALDGKEVDEYVYNVEVNDSHEYFADDYLVHNKQAQREISDTTHCN